MTKAELAFESAMAATSPAMVERLVEGDPERNPGARSERSRKAKASRRLGHDLANRAVAVFEGLGYMAFRCDSTTVVAGGALMTVDMLGFGDVLAIKDGRSVLVQSCVVEGLRAHERKLVDRERRVPRIGESPYECALAWLRHGGGIVICAFEKDARGWWESTLHIITEEALVARAEGLDARRSKRG